MMTTSMFVVLVSFACFGAVTSQESISSLFIPVKHCVPSCTNSIRVSREVSQDTATAELSKFPDIQKKIAGLEAESRQKKLSIIPPKRCPCNSNCKAVQERLYSCGNCRIVWPYNGVVNTKCSTPNSYCPLGCGCPGRCNADDPRSQWVVLYCPRTRPVPFIIKKIRLCSSCCCKYSYIHG